MLDPKYAKIEDKVIEIDRAIGRLMDVVDAEACIQVILQRAIREYHALGMSLENLMSFIAKEYDLGYYETDKV